jgi:hypothetical protein
VLLQRLRRLQSPFGQTVSGIAGCAAVVDVPSIHRPAMAAIQAILSELSDPGDVARGALLVGPAGSGKTHVGDVIRARLAAEAGACFFARVEPIAEPARPARHLLDQIVSSLVRRLPGSDGEVQLARLVGDTAGEFLRARARPEADPKGPLAASGRLPDAGELDELGSASSWDRLAAALIPWLLGQSESLSSTCLAVVIQYAVRARRRLALEWLRGVELDDEELGTLGVQLGSGDAGAEPPEVRAILTLRTLGGLMARSRPFVVVVDPLHRAVRPESLQVADRMVRILLAELRRALVVCAVRPDWWERAAPSLAPALVERMSLHRLELCPCSADDARQLVRGRLAVVQAGAGLAAALSPDEPSDLFPFDSPGTRAAVDDEVSVPGSSPRQVIHRAARLWARVVGRAPDGPSDRAEQEVLASSLASCRAAIAADLEAHGPGEADLITSLELAIAYPPAVAGYRCRAVQPGPRDGLHLTADIGPWDQESVTVRIGIVLNARRHHAAAATLLERAMRALEERAVAGVLVVRDGRVPFPAPPRWPVTNQLQADLAAKGAMVLELAARTLPTWLAMAALSRVVESGELEFADPDGQIRPVSRYDLARFVVERAPFPELVAVLSALLARAAAGVPR